MNRSTQPRLHPTWIDNHAHGIVKALKKSEFETYLVGGCVRDLLLGISPKDFDIATMAQPEEVRKVIYKSYVIGKRFRLVLVKRDDLQYEVATFRKNISDFSGDEEELPEGDNVFGSPEEDAMRRDFTINGMFYDPVEDKLIDYTGGLEDLEGGVIRMIGAPRERLLEDPIRILRALRLAHKIGFSIEPSLRTAMLETSSSLLESALPRRREEFLKLMKLEDPSLAFIEAYDLGILKSISPQLESAFSDADTSQHLTSHLAQTRSLWLDDDSPLELFGYLVYSYLVSTEVLELERPIKANDLLEHPAAISLMRDELGMFKYEQALLAKAIQMQSVLRKRLEFERKGLRRQFAVLKNEAFPLALKLAIRGHHLTGADVHFWLSSYWRAKSEIEDLRRAEQHKRKDGGSRRRRRKKPHSNDDKSSKSHDNQGVSGGESS